MDLFIICFKICLYIYLVMMLKKQNLNFEHFEHTLPIHTLKMATFAQLLSLDCFQILVL